MIDTGGEKHRYGQHYTPRNVAKLLAAFAVRSESDLVFDPSCGDGRLLAEAQRLKRIKSSRRRRRAAPEVYGVDRSAQAVKHAAKTGARVAVADFFDVKPGATISQAVTLPEAFDAIVGNPPYIRQEVIGDKDKQRIRARLDLDRAASRDIFWSRWSGRSDIYVYFFAHATCFLRRNGRLVFLTSSSWLDVGYGAALREFLLANFSVIAVIESGCESFFDDASINTSITVLEREADPARRRSNLVRFVKLCKPLAEILKASKNRSGTSASSAIKLARSIERVSVPATFDTRVRLVKQSELTPAVAGRQGFMRSQEHSWSWGRFLRADDIFFRVLERGGARLQPLSDLARVRFGVKTGANDFFYVDERSTDNGSMAKAAGNLRALNEVASVRRGLTTGVNDFFYLPAPSPQPAFPIIESQYLSPVVFSLKEIPDIILARAPAKKLFFNCSASKDELIGTGALRYIEEGERAGFHLRPTCASRDPWYAVARGIKPAPLIFPSKIGERWLVALNRSGVFEDKKLYGIFPANGVSELTLAALLNSTWSRYYTEVTCRQMTGAQAIADIDVAVAGQIMIPDPRELSPRIRRELESALKAIACRPVLSVFDEIVRADRRRLDALFLEAMGFNERLEREEALNQLYEAASALVRARLTKRSVTSFS
ncbi:MAG TPA: N-6 DNA methylase [Blastocatellia bacterium]